MHVKIAPAALSSLLLMARSLRVVDGRTRWRASVGDGVGPELSARLRAQAHGRTWPPDADPDADPAVPASAVPGGEAPGSGRFVTEIAALVLLARVAHPSRPVPTAPNPCRATGMPGLRLAMVPPALAPLGQVAGS